MKFIAALNGNTAGGGYEVALACDEILMIDDRSSAVSLPEVPLLGVLPGTGGLTRLTDKRKVRRDLADMFCTTTEGVRAERALQWRLVDAIAKPAKFQDLVAARAGALARSSDRPGGRKGIVLEAISRHTDERGYHYEYVDAQVNRAARLEVCSRSLFAVVDRESCFAGTLAELLLAADRSYMMAFPGAPGEEPCVILSPVNFGPYRKSTVSATG